MNNFRVEFYLSDWQIKAILFDRIMTNHIIDEPYRTSKKWCMDLVRVYLRLFGLSAFDDHASYMTECAPDSPEIMNEVNELYNKYFNL